jgi:hypothetical protein
MLVLVMVSAMLAYSTAGSGSAFASGFHDFVWAGIVLSSFPRAMLIMAGTFGLWRAGIVSNKLFAAGVIAVVLVLLGGTTWMNGGLWGPDGAYSRIISPAIGFAWVVVVSRILLSTSSVSRARWWEGRHAPWIQMLDGGLTLPDPTRSDTVFYSDCDARTGEWAKSELRPQSRAAFEEPVPYPAWRHTPSIYVVCANDMAMPTELQRNVFAPRATETIELQADHSPFLSQPDAVAELLAVRSRYRPNPDAAARLLIERAALTNETLANPVDLLKHRSIVNVR